MQNRTVYQVDERSIGMTRSKVAPGATRSENGNWGGAFYFHGMLSIESSTSFQKSLMIY